MVDAERKFICVDKDLFVSYAMLRFFILFLFLPLTSLADHVKSFDDFEWGTSRTEIIQIRGNPTYLYDTSMSYSSPPDVIGGYGVEVVYFRFKEGCSVLKESISEPCYLWRGDYRLLTKSEAEFQKLIEVLSGIYGESYKETTNKDELDYYTKTFLAENVFTDIIFEQSDGSSVVLAKHEYDRDFYNKLMEKTYKKGIQNIYVRYQSSEYNQIQKRKELKNKGF